MRAIVRPTGHGLIDDDASLAAFVDGRLAAVTMIRIDRASGERRATSPARDGSSGVAASRRCSSHTAFVARPSWA